MSKKLERKLINLRVDASWLERLDAWIASQKIRPSRTQVIIAAVDRLMAEDARNEMKERERQPC